MSTSSFRTLVLVVLAAMVIVTVPRSVAGADSLIPLKVEVGVGDEEGPKEVSKTIQLFLLLTVLSLAPAILVMVTSFTRIVVVLGFVKRALSTTEVPPQQVVAGLAQHHRQLGPPGFLHVQPCIGLVPMCVVLHRQGERSHRILSRLTSQLRGSPRTQNTQRNA